MFRPIIFFVNIGVICASGFALAETTPLTNVVVEDLGSPTILSPAEVPKVSLKLMDFDKILALSERQDGMIESPPLIDSTVTPATAIETIATDTIATTADHSTSTNLQGSTPTNHNDAFSVLQTTNHQVVSEQVVSDQATPTPHEPLPLGSDHAMLEEPMHAVVQVPNSPVAIATDNPCAVCQSIPYSNGSGTCHSGNPCDGSGGPCHSCNGQCECQRGGLLGDCKLHRLHDQNLGRIDLFCERPFGVCNEEFANAMILAGKADRAILHHYDFADDSDGQISLTPRGQRELVRIADVVAAYPVSLSIEPTYDQALDIARQRAVIDAIAHMNLPIAPENVQIRNRPTIGLSGLDSQAIQIIRASEIVTGASRVIPYSGFSRANVIPIFSGGANGGGVDR